MAENRHGDAGLKRNSWETAEDSSGIVSCLELGKGSLVLGISIS